ncbi:MAG: hypothetical protein CML46_05915 [Rhodobacteraceae bacterium]|nr:hypothetical protein [Paracoccaceae bacterium]MBR26461.1 hypothetical protein [Paracoccaceae bacterium]
MSFLMLRGVGAPVVAIFTADRRAAVAIGLARDLRPAPPCGEAVQVRSPTECAGAEAGSSPSPPSASSGG